MPRPTLGEVRIGVGLERWLSRSIEHLAEASELHPRVHVHQTVSNGNLMSREKPDMLRQSEGFERIHATLPVRLIDTPRDGNADRPGVRTCPAVQTTPLPKSGPTTSPRLTTTSR